MNVVERQFYHISSGFYVNLDHYNKTISIIENIEIPDIYNTKELSNLIEQLKRLYLELSIMFCNNSELTSLLDIYYSHIMKIVKNRDRFELLNNIKICFRFLPMFIGFAHQSVWYEKTELPKNLNELITCELLSNFNELY